MENVLLFLHSLLRWIILVLLILSIVRSFSGWKSKKAFSTGDGKMWLFLMISAHITLVLGLYQLFFGRYGIAVTSLPEGTQVMKDKFFRFFWVEHPFGMIVSVVLITLGRRMSKPAIPDTDKYKKAFWYFFIALIVILATVPWPFRDIVGRPWIY